MKLVIEANDSMPCAVEKFLINEKNADRDDFGEMRDIEPNNPDDGDEGMGCGNYIFIPDIPRNGVLDKYKITLEEYEIICSELKEKFNVGYCGECI